MAGLADLIYATQGPMPQTYAVPDPRMGIADLLAGAPISQQSAPAPTPAPSTAYADSPAPGSVAQAGAEVTAAASNEPGILDRARNWAKTNPIAAQGLMQGFAALASGRTHGNAFMQLGQAAGTGMQAMTEQEAANAAQQREIQAQQQRQALAERQEGRLDRTATSTIALNERQDTRAEASNKENIAASQQRRGQIGQAMQQSAAMFTPKMQEARLKLDSLRQQIAAGGTDQQLKGLQVQLKRHELDIARQFGPQEAQLIVDNKAQELANRQEQGVGYLLDNEGKMIKNNTYKSMTEEERKNDALGIKPKGPTAPMSDQDIAMKLYTEDPTPFLDKDGKLSLERLGQGVQNFKKATNYNSNARQEAFNQAKLSVQPGGRFFFEGREFEREK